MEWSNLGSALPCPHLHCNAMVSLHAQEEKEHTAVLSGTCGVQNAVITNSGRPIYVTRPAASWWTPAYCLPLLPPSSHRSCPASALLLYNQPSRAQHLLFSNLVCWSSSNASVLNTGLMSQCTELLVFSFNRQSPAKGLLCENDYCGDKQWREKQC